MFRIFSARVSKVRTDPFLSVLTRFCPRFCPFEGDVAFAEAIRQRD
jgi:hypothetical protein